MSSLVNVNTSDVDRLRYALIVEASRISLRPTIERMCFVLGVGVTVPIDSRQIGSGFKKKL